MAKEEEMLGGDKIKDPKPGPQHQDNIKPKMLPAGDVDADGRVSRAAGPRDTRKTE